MHARGVLERGPSATIVTFLHPWPHAHDKPASALLRHGKNPFAGGGATTAHGGRLIWARVFGWARPRDRQMWVAADVSAAGSGQEAQASRFHTALAGSVSVTS